MAEIHIHFLGSWSIFIDVGSVRVNLDNTKEAKDYVDTTYGPMFETKLKSMGVNKKESVWDNSIVFLNGKKIQVSGHTVFKEGDRLELVPLISGG